MQDILIARDGPLAICAANFWNGLFLLRCDCQTREKMTLLEQTDLICAAPTANRFPSSANTHARLSA